MGDRTGKDRRGRVDDELLQGRMDPVRCNNDVGGGACAIGEREDGLMIVLLEADAPVAGMHDAGR